MLLVYDSHHNYSFTVHLFGFVIPLSFTLVSILEIDNNCDYISQKSNVLFLDIQVFSDSRHLNAIPQRNADNRGLNSTTRQIKIKIKRIVKALQTTFKKI